MKFLKAFGSAVGLIYALFVYSENAYAAASPTKTIDVILGASIGRDTAPEDANTSLLLEPQINYYTAEKSYFALAAKIDRPFDPYENFAVPEIVLAYKQDLDLFEGYSTSLRGYIIPLGITNWDSDGYQVRNQIAFDISKEVFKNFKVLFRVAAFGQINEFTQAADGADLPGYGFNQRIYLAYEFGRFLLDLRLIVAQKHYSLWKNEYYTYEALSYELFDDFSVGLSHELLNNVVDPTTGFYRSIQVFDGRSSRISAFVEWKI